MLKVIIMMLSMLMMNSTQIVSITCIMIITLNVNNQHTDMTQTSYIITGDSMSFWVINLTIWIMMIILMIKTNKQATQTKLSSIITLILTLSFWTWNFMIFFITFEMSMMAIIIMVVSWGYQPERIEAILFMLLMTSMFSLPFFFTLMVNSNSLNFWFFKKKLLTWEYISFMLIFMIKMPTYFIHIWLPKVHVEAPIQGSMILAAIMLKLGCYGMLRAMPMALELNQSWKTPIFAFAMYTAIATSLATSIQSDLKSLIAYSSIVHMTTTWAMIILTKQKSIIASIITMIGHGLCSSALFFLCNFMYKQTKSRSILLNKGMLTSSTTLMTIWFILCMSNAGMPPAINVLGELFMLKTMLDWSQTTLPLMFILMLTSFYYNMILFYLPSHGKFSNSTKMSLMIPTKTLLISLLHIIPMMMITIKSNIIEI